MNLWEAAPSMREAIYEQNRTPSVAARADGTDPGADPSDAVLGDGPHSGHGGNDVDDPSVRRHRLPDGGGTPAIVRQRGSGRKHWPIGPNTGFLRKNATTFVVTDWTSMGVGKALATTVATATLSDDGSVDVVNKSRGKSVGYLFIAIGLGCVAVVPRDGIGALLLALASLAFGRWWSLSSSWRQADLDEVESAMRSELDGDWRTLPR